MAGIKELQQELDDLREEFRREKEALWKALRCIESHAPELLQPLPETDLAGRRVKTGQHIGTQPGHGHGRG